MELEATMEPTDVQQDILAPLLPAGESGAARLCANAKMDTMSAAAEIQKCGNESCLMI